MLQISSAVITLKGDEPLFKDIGSGRKNFVHWGNASKAFLFYVPRLVFIKVSVAKLKVLSPFIRGANPQPFLMAIEANRSAARVQGHWDGGKAAELLIELLSGKAIKAEEFTKVAEEPNKPLHGVDTKRAEPEVPATAEELAADDAAHAAKIASTNAEMIPQGAILDKDGKVVGVHTSNRKTKAPTKAEVAEMKKAKAAKKAGAKKPAKAKVAKAAKVKAPEGHIIIKADGNPRREGTKAGDRFKSMKAYVGRHPKADVADVIANTSYRRDDLKWDIKAKSIEVRK